MLFFRPPALTSLKRRDWRKRRVPAACDAIPTMLIEDELRLLEFLTEEYFKGQGVIVDAGCFQGGSTLALASGLRKNLARRRQPEKKLIHSYDLFQIEDWTRGVYFPPDARAGDDILPIFEQHIKAFAPLIEVHRGDITRTTWTDGPIEILFIDVAKHWTVCDWITANLFPHLIPGKSIVIQQDYLYHHWNAWLHITMEYFREHFEMTCDTEYNSVAFRYTRALDPATIPAALVSSLSLPEQTALMDRAASRYSGRQRDWLLASKEHFIGMVSDAR